MAGTWFSRLFQPGGERRSPPDHRLNEAVGYPGLRLARHFAEGDLVSEPRLIWEGQGVDADGLRAHVLAEPDLDFTDVLLILSTSDFLRATATGGVPWLVRLQEELIEAYAELRQGMPHLPQRRMRVRLARDGSGDVGQQDFGLGPGEFVTGLTPQLYTGRARRSTPQLAIHLNLPAVDGELRQVGVLYDDQPCFTLGSHWLDSFGHPELERPGLFRVVRDPDGQPVYELRPDLEGPYHLELGDQGGVNVITVHAGGQPLAHLVLELLSGPEVDHRAEALRRLRLSQPLERVAERLAEAGVSQARAGQERRPNAPIDSVILLADRAVVTRVLAAELPEGTGELCFEGLLPELSGRDLEAELRGGRARVLGVELISSDRRSGPSGAEALAEARAAADQLTELVERVSELLRQKAALARSALRGEGSPGATPGLHGRLAELRRAEAGIEQAIAEAVAQGAGLDDALSTLLLRLERPEPAGHVARVRLSCARAGRVEVALRYRVRQARWSPRVRARLRPRAARLELELLADLQQSSGEDWTEVKLFLSPDPGGQRLSPPEVEPWALHEGLSALLAAHPRAGLTVVEEGGAGLGDADLIEVPERLTLAHGAELRAHVATHRLKVSPSGACAPRLDPVVYRQVTLEPEAVPDLPPGPLACFVDQQFVGADRWPGPRGPLRLGFGPDPALRAERRLIGRSSGPEGHDFHYRTTLTNRGPAPARVEVVDQVPLGPAVRGVRAEGPGGQTAAHDPATGALRWTVEVPPGQAALLDLRFTVSA